MNEMNKIHIWIGTTNKSEEEYNQYFEQDYSFDIDDPHYIPCGFCRDIDIRWYDEDFHEVHFYNEYISIKTIVEEYLPVHKTEIPRVLSVCAQLNIETANAAFLLTDAKITIPQPYKDNYNSLKFIGTFTSEFAG